jgi:uncharacterized membrane protein YidH (DUF202 family)
MTGTEWLLTIIIVVGWLAFVIWFKKYSNRKAAEAGKSEEFERNKARVSIILYPVLGLMIIAVMLFALPNVPPGNEPLVALTVGFGVLFMLYGALKWYRGRR